MASPALANAQTAPGQTAPGQASPAQGTNGPQSDFPVVVGPPYQVGGVTFVPSDSMNFDSVGYAVVGSADGMAITAAHHTLPVPSYAEVTDLKTGRTILVRIDRRGPMDAAQAIELSPGAATQLGLSAGAKAAVRVRRVNPPENERMLLRSGNPAPERMPTPKPLLDVLQRKLHPGMAQRTLDNGDDEAAPAKAAPVVPAKMAPPSAPKAPVAKTVAPVSASKASPPSPKPADAGAPPKGYVPSVPAPAVKAGARATTPKTSPKTPAEKKPVEPVIAQAPKKPEPAPKTAPKTAKPEEHTEAATKSAASLAIQAGAFSDKARAQAVADKIGGTLTKAGAVWRVRVGPYTSHGSAEAALAKVKSAGYSDARIQRAE